MSFITLLFSDPFLYIQMVCIVIVSIVLHELAHGWAAISYDDDTPLRTGHMNLNPLVHMGEVSLVMLCLTGIAWGAMPVNPSKFSSPKWGNVVVSLAGPVANLALALLLVSGIKLLQTHGSDNFAAISDLLFRAALCNVGLFLFNLIPVPPLDGFHALSEFLPSLKIYQNSPYGSLALLLLFSTGLSHILSAIATFLLGMAIVL